MLLTSEQLEDIRTRAAAGSVLRSEDDALQADTDRDRLLTHIDWLTAERDRLRREHILLTEVIKQVAGQIAAVEEDNK